MEIQEQTDGPVTGRLDSATSPPFGDRLAAVAGEGGAVLLDLTQTAFVSSAGLRVMLVALKAAKKSGGRLALCGARPEVREVLEVTGFAALLSLHPDRATAMTWLGGAP